MAFREEVGEFGERDDGWKGGRRQEEVGEDCGFGRRHDLRRGVEREVDRCKERLRK